MEEYERTKKEHPGLGYTTAAILVTLGLICFLCKGSLTKLAGVGLVGFGGMVLLDQLGLLKEVESSGTEKSSNSCCQSILAMRQIYDDNDYGDESDDDYNDYGDESYRKDYTYEADNRGINLDYFTDEDLGYTSDGENIDFEWASNHCDS